MGPDLLCRLADRRAGAGAQLLGLYVLGLEFGPAAFAFGALVAVCLTASYAAMGAAWLIYKTEGDLQKKAVRFLRYALAFTAIGMVAIFPPRRPFASPRIFEKNGSSGRRSRSLAPLPVVSTVLMFAWLVAAHLHPAGTRRPPRAVTLPGAGRHLRARLCGPGLFLLPPMSCPSA